MKTDARSRYTKHIIQSIFLDLLKEKPISKITVKEICERADINRGTFYKHYEDIYDLMRKLEETALNQLELLLLDSMQKGNVPVLITLLTFLMNYHDLIESLAANSPNKDFLSKLAERCSQHAISHLPSDNGNYINNPNKQYTYSYLVGGTTMLIEHWLKTGAKEAPAVIAGKIDFLNKHILSSKL